MSPPSQNGAAGGRWVAKEIQKRRVSHPAFFSVRALSFDDLKCQNAVGLGLRRQFMAVFIAEMRDIDDGGRIICQEANARANGQRLHPFAQAQDGQGAQEADCVDFKDFL